MLQEEEMKQVLIIEDDIIIATHISRELMKANYGVDGIITSGEAAMAHLKTSLPDIIILDITLKGEIDGIEVAQHVATNYDIPIVYLTANSDEATFSRAKLTKPEAFITKPFKPKQFIRTLALVASRLEETSPSDKPLKESTTVFEEDKVFIRQKDRMMKIALKDILYIEADRNYCSVYTVDKTYTLSIPMKNFADQVNSGSFQRIHRSFMINLAHIDGLDEHYVFVGKKHLPISKTYKSDLFQRLKLL